MFLSVNSYFMRGNMALPEVSFFRICWCITQNCIFLFI